MTTTRPLRLLLTFTAALTVTTTSTGCFRFGLGQKLVQGMIGQTFYVNPEHLEVAEDAPSPPVIPALTEEGTPTFLKTEMIHAEWGRDDRGLQKVKTPAEAAKAKAAGKNMLIAGGVVAFVGVSAFSYGLWDLDRHPVCEDSLVGGCPWVGRDLTAIFLGLPVAAIGGTIMSLGGRAMINAPNQPPVQADKPSRGWPDTVEGAAPDIKVSLTFQF